MCNPNKIQVDWTRASLPRIDKIKRIYEDDDFIIDLIAGEQPMIRVSIFKDNHFQDEVFIRKEDYIEHLYNR